MILATTVMLSRFTIDSSMLLKSSGKKMNSNAFPLRMNNNTYKKGKTLMGFDCKGFKHH